MTTQEQARQAALRSYAILDTPPEPDFDHVVRLAARLLDVPIALISLLDNDRQWFKASTGLDGVRATPRDLAFCDHAIRDTTVMIVPDATADPRFATNELVTGDPRIRFYAGAPLVTREGHALGTLCVIDRRPHHGMTERDIAILSDLAIFVRDKLELRREKRRSKASAEQAALLTRLMAAAAESPDFASAIHAAAVAIAEATGGLFCHVWRLAADGERAVFIGGTGQGVLGEEEHFFRLTAMTLTPANSQVAAALVEERQVWSDMAPGPETASRPAASLAGQLGVTLQLATPFGLGEERYAFSVGLANPPDQPEAMAGMMREATAALRPMLRRHREEADSRLFRRLIETSANGVLVCEPPFEEPGPHIIFANAAFERMTRYSLAEIKGRSPRLLYGPQSVRDPRRIKGEIAAGRSVTEEVLNYRKDGTTFWSSVRIAPVADSNGTVTHYISSQTDITAMRQAQLERDALTQDLQTLVAAIPGVLMRHRLRGDGKWTRAFIAPGVEALTGYTVEEAFAFGWLMENIDEADRPRLYAALRSAIDDGQSRIDFRFRQKAGAWIWIRILMRGHLASDGAREVIGVWSDISDEYRLAAEREAKTRELETVIDTLPGVLIRSRRDAQGVWKRIQISSNIIELTGHSVEEAMGDAWWSDNVEPDVARRAVAFFSGADTALPREGEFLFRHKRGHQIWIRRRSRGYVDENGVQELVSIWNDITDQKNLMLEREALTAELQNVIATMPGMLMRIHKNEEGRWVRYFMSPSVEAITGFTVEEAQRADWLPNNLDPADRASMLALLAEGDPTAPATTYFRFRHKRGHNIWIMRNTSGYVDSAGRVEVISIWNDITAEKNLMLEREAKTRELETLIETLPGVLVRSRRDAQGNWNRILVSANVIDLTGFSVAEAMRDAWWLENAEPDMSPGAVAFYDGEPTPIPREGEFRFRHKRGHWIWIRRRSRRYQDDNGAQELVSFWNDFTEQKNLLLEREKLTADLQRIITTMPGVLVQLRQDGEGTWVCRYISPAIEALTGFTVEETKRPNWWLDNLHTAERDRLPSLVYQADMSERQTVTFRFRHKQGHYIWIHRTTSGYLAPCGQPEVISIWNDVTAEQRLLIDREELASDLQAVIDAMPGVLMRIRNSGDHWDRIYVAPGIEALTGYSVAEAMHPQWKDDNLDPAERGLLVGQMRGHFSQDQLSVEFRFRHKQGHWIWIRRIARGHVDDQGVREIIAIWQDVTHEKSLAEQYAQSAKLAQLGEVATGMAHELNQPLAGISLAAENAKRSLTRLPEPPQRALEKLALIVDLTKRASDIIDHMRIFGRTDTASRGPVPVAEVVKGAGQLLASKLLAGSVRLQTSLPEGLPPVLGKAVPLEQVIMNLISNACDAYVGLREPVPTERRVIGVTAHAEADWISIEVRDAAGGIPDEVLPRIFEPFFTTKPVGQGTGLGLSISYGIISDMGGTISAENHAGGCLMRILLPVAR